MEKRLAARKAHPGLRCTDYDALLAHLRLLNVAVREDDELPDVRRAYVDDPFGNRLELIEAGSALSQRMREC